MVPGNKWRNYYKQSVEVRCCMSYTCHCFKGVLEKNLKFLPIQFKTPTQNKFANIKPEENIQNLAFRQVSSRHKASTMLLHFCYKIILMHQLVTSYFKGNAVKLDDN